MMENTSAKQFQRDKRLPFAECRYTRSSQSTFKPHIHSTVSIGAVDTGLVRYRVGDREATLRPGSLALINPEALHACNALAGQNRSYYMLYLDVEWCRAVQQSLWHIDSFVTFDSIRIDDSSLYRQYCDVMSRLMGSPMHIQEKEQLLFDMVSTIFQMACKPQELRSTRHENIELLKQILRQDLHKDYTLDSLAEILQANPYTLIRRFKAETGLTPHAYRMNCRIEQARRLLREGKDIADTAMECGFFDQSHLHRHFKAMTTVTPQEYRINFVQ